MKTETGRAALIRDTLKAQGPMNCEELQQVLGEKYAVVWGACWTMIRGKILACDENGRYSVAREPRAKRKPADSPAERDQRERERSQRRAAQRRKRLANLSAEELEARRLVQRARERALYDRRNAKRKAERLAAGKVPRSFRLVQNKEVRQRDHDQRTSEKVAAAKAMRNKEHGTRDQATPEHFPCSAAFIAAHPHLHHVIGNGVVSPASRLKCMEARA
jgi:hypothetical protein